MKRDTGSPRADAESDFLRARRHEVLASLAARFRTDGVADSRALSFDDAVHALGRRGERRLGTLVIPLDRIVGSVDKAGAFDRSFRPTSARARSRWERIAEAVRRGESMPPIDVYKLGEMCLRHRRTSPGLGLSHARPGPDQGQRDRDRDDGPRHTTSAASRTSTAALAPHPLRPGASARRGAQADEGHRARRLRPRRRDGRGLVGTPDLCRGGLCRPRHDGAALVRRGVRARDGDDRRDRPAGSARDRGRRLPADRVRALPDQSRARLGRRGASADPEGEAQAASGDQVRRRLRVEDLDLGGVQPSSAFCPGATFEEASRRAFICVSAACMSWPVSAASSCRSWARTASPRRLK